MKRRLVAEIQLLSKPVFLHTVLEIHSKLETKIVIMEIEASAVSGF
jgi:hypothetical protein